MPYIAPNTKLYILKGVPLDNTYEHTVYYANSTTQLNAFLAYKKYELEKLSYQRTGAGLMRVQLTYEQMYDCNYMIFKNTSYGNKWWYAFITGVAYVNNSTCEISYEIDVMQTWCYDYTFMQSFVEREHIDPIADRPENFANHYWQPEGLETGAEPTIVSTKRISGGLRSIVLIATETNSGIHQSFGMLNHYYTPLHVSIYDCGDDLSSVPQAFYTEMDGYKNNGKLESIMSIGAGPGAVNGRSGVLDIFTFNPEEGLYTNEAINYHPKNSKLFIYPFHFYRISDQSGNYQILRPEWFDSLTKIRFYTVSYSYPTAVSTIVPVNYHGPRTVTDDNALTDEESFEVLKNGAGYSLTITDYPTYAVDNDTYKAWWAQNKNSYIASMGNVKRSYNAEMANIGNNYAQQMVASQNSVNNANLSALTTANNANRSNQTNFSNQTRTNFVSGAESLASGLGSLLDLDFSGVASGAMGAVHAGINQMNNRASMQTNEQNIAASLATATTIAGNNYSTAKTLAELSRQASSLSALTNNQNATASLVAKKQDMLNAPDGYVGNISGSVVKADNKLFGFVLEEVCVNYIFLKMADDYFEKYGYKIAMMETPRRMNNRPYWHYLQTTGCNIKGNFNDTDISAIKTIYNNGITTWNALENVGNYSLNNHTSASTLSEEVNDDE